MQTGEQRVTLKRRESERKAKEELERLKASGSRDGSQVLRTDSLTYQVSITNQQLKGLARVQVERMCCCQCQKRLA